MFIDGSGDISDSVNPPSFFPVLNAVCTRSCTDMISCAEPNNGDGLNFKIDKNLDKKKTKLSQKLFSGWFFRRQHLDEEANDNAGQTSQVTKNLKAKDGEEEKGGLTSLISKQFSAATEFRNLNFSVPQST